MHLLDANNILDITLKEIYKERIEIQCANDFKQQCYFILAGLMVDYEEQVFITVIKANIQYPICHFPQRKKEIVTKL